jgi:hypothetical protein
MVSGEALGRGDACERLSAARRAPPSAGNACDPAAVTATSAPGLAWISAPLDLPSDNRDPDFILLGWLMKDRSHQLIADQTACLTKPVWDALSAAVR